MPQIFALFATTAKSPGERHVKPPRETVGTAPKKCYTPILQNVITGADRFCPGLRGDCLRKIGLHLEIVGKAVRITKTVDGVGNKENRCEMKKPTYKHPDFVTNVESNPPTLGKTATPWERRFSLTLEIDKNSSEELLVILKNPSQATKDVSDKTVQNVTNYVHQNKRTYPQLKNTGRIIIANLIPFYLTDAKGLVERKSKIIDKQNIETITDLAKKCKNVIIAWGNPPSGLTAEYRKLTQVTLDILRENNNHVFYVDKLSQKGKGNPKHGLRWRCGDKLKKFDG